MASQIDPSLPEETSGPNIGKVLIARLRQQLTRAKTEIEQNQADIEQSNNDIAGLQNAVQNLTTTNVDEGASNKYFTFARVRDTVLDGLSLAVGPAITAADSVLSALGKLQKQISDHLNDAKGHMSAAQKNAGATGFVASTSDGMNVMSEGVEYWPAKVSKDVQGNITNILNWNGSVAIPIISGNRMSGATCGDSRSANHLSASLQLSARGPFMHATLKLNGKLRFGAGDIYGVSETKIKDGANSALAQLVSMPDKYNVIAIFTGINDIYANSSASKLASDMADLIAEGLKKTAVLFLHTEVVTSVMTPAQRAVVDSYNTWLRKYVIGKRIVLTDVYSIAVDWSSATNQPLAGSYYDALHYSPALAEKIGNAHATAIEKIAKPAGWVPMVSREDVYNPVTRPYGNLLGVNGAMAAGGGSNRDLANNAGSASTGTVAAGCRLFKTNNHEIGVLGVLTTVNVQYLDTQITIPVQDIVISTGGIGNKLCQFQIPDVTTDIAVNDKIVLVGFINVVKAIGLLSLSAYLQERNSSGAVQQTLGPFTGFASGGIYYPTSQTAKQFFFESAPMTLTAAVSYLRGFFDFVVDGATADTQIQVGLVAVKKSDLQ